jgi:hypothetical protein
MAFLLPLVSASLLGTGLAFSHLLWPQETKRYGPCSSIKKDTPDNDQVFSLPDGSNICEDVSEAAKSYSQYYFNPRNNFRATGSFFTPVQGSSFQPFIDGILQDTYTTFAPSGFDASNWPNGGVENPTVLAWIANLTSGAVTPPTPLNFMPQQYSTAGNNVVGASTVSLPLNQVNSLPLETLVWAISGPSSSTTPNNVPYAFDNSADGLTTTVYLYFTKSLTVYLEVGGAFGGNFTVYANGVSPETGTALPLDPGFSGGRPGVVYGTYQVGPGDVLKVFLGIAGQERNNVNGALEFNGLGQGGFATIFGGSNGGGASYVYHFKCPNFTNGPWDALNFALTDASKGTFVCCAAGGGGASRNASGGSAGSSDTKEKPLLYGSAVTTVASGSAGGKANFTGPAPFVVQALPNDLSGGGGLNTIGGQSNVPDQTPEGASSGTSLKPPFLDSRRTGGGSVVTSSGSGGGGGGGGLNGGGAGGWNGLPKPNNLHGAGGGGYSTFGLLRPVARGSPKGSPANFNIFRGLWPRGNIEVSVWPTGARDGYLVLGLPQVA